jgi:tripartite-type tricarboxylate transporter receptor subunit TctC
MSRLVQAVLAIAAVCASGAARAEYPERPIRVVLPFAAAGTTDIVTRILMERVSQSFGQTIVIDNRPGAAGNIALDAVAKSAPDGDTLASADPFSTMPANATLFADLSFHPVRDLAPIANFGFTDVALIVNKDLPAKDINEFVALAKSKPGELLYGSTGNGSPGHLNGALLSRQLGIKTVHVPYRNGAQGTTDLLAGRLHFWVAPIPTRLEQVRQGALRVLAVGRKQRTADLPDVPTVGETGYGDFEGSTAYALFAPKGTPGPIIDKLYGEVRKAMDDESVRKRLIAAGMEPRVMPPVEVTKMLETQIAKWADIIKSSDIRMDNAAR